jgi:hypothetical protein
MEKKCKKDVLECLLKHRFSFNEIALIEFDEIILYSRCPVRLMKKKEVNTYIHNEEKKKELSLFFK